MNHAWLLPKGIGGLNNPTQAKEVCKKCNTIGRWVDHGPTVGKGWYCGTCKDDIPSDDNVYGHYAQKKIEEKKSVGQPYIGAQPSVWGQTHTRRVRLNCTKDICPACGGKYKGAHVNVQPGDRVICENNARVSKDLGMYKEYIVLSVDAAKENIRVMTLGTSTKEYSRCRFAVTQ
jgi:hypothetical protein